MEKEIQDYHAALTPAEKLICDKLYYTLRGQIPQAERKIWHAHPVWFLDGNPIVGYSKLKSCIRLLFWSGQSFNEPALLHEGKFKAAELRFTNLTDIDPALIERCLEKAQDIQWDYGNLVKRKGQLLKLGNW